MSATAFTLIELLVTVAVIGVLAALLIPALSAARRKADSTRCLSNLRQLGVAVRLYADDNQGRLPGAPAFNAPTSVTGDPPPIHEVLLPQVNGAREVFKCPADKAGVFDRVGSSYEWNTALNGRMLSRIGEDSTDARALHLLRDREAWHPRGRRNAVFADGHAAQEKQ